MTFRTELIVSPLATPLPPRARVLTIGSCFAAVLGQKLAAAKLPVLENPFGTVLNPVSACRLLAVAAGADDYDLTERTVLRDGRWFSYDAPSGVSGATPEELQRAIEERLAQVRDFVRSADLLVLTMGTAWAWRLDGEVVANCHKQPGGLFTKSLLSVQETVTAFAEAHAWLLRLNPKLRVVLTVSPVRHPKETLTGSSVSKSTLRLACHHLAGLVRDVTYFPAYELLLDDLRDYRFFAADMLHPSPLAEEYIFDKFVGAYFDVRFVEAREAWAEIQRSMAHRSANPKGEEHQRFLLTTLDKLDTLAERGFDVKAETEELTNQLIRPRRVGYRPEKVEQEIPAKAPVVVPAGPVPKLVPPIAPTLPKPAPAVTPPAMGTPGRSAKPIIKIELPPDEMPGRRPDRGQRPPMAKPMVVQPAPAPEEVPVVVVPDLPVEVPMAVEEAVMGTPAEMLGTEDPGSGAESTGSTRKRRGKRGGKRNKQRREAAALAAQANGASDDDSEDLEEEVSEDVSTATELPVMPAEAVAAPNALPEMAAATEVEADETSKASNGTSRRSSRGGRGRGSAKKVTLQKVKPAPVAASEKVETPAPAPVMPPVMPPVAVVTETQSAPRSDSRRNQRRGPKTQPAPTAAPPVAATSVATPPPPLPPAPVAEAAPASPAPEQRTARTPARGRSKGPVATPTEKAEAARTVKKAGVSALLMALGGGAAAPAVAEPTPIAAPAAPAAPQPAPGATKPAAKPAAKSVAKPVAKPAAKPKAAPAPKPAKAIAAVEPVPVPKAAPKAAASRKEPAPAPKAPAKAAAPRKPAPKAAPAPAPAPEPAPKAARTPAKPRTPKKS